MRTIHFTWKDERPPEEVFPRWWRESWGEEGWQIRLWTDRDIMEFTGTQPRKIRELMSAYTSGVMRSDAFRYFVLKRYGGLYVDLDFVKLSPLSWLKEVPRFACAEQGDGCLCNAFLWAPVPEDPFFEGIEDSLLAASAESNPVSATGPRFLTSHAAGKTFFRIPSPWLYPVAWDNEEEITLARRLGAEDLKRRYPEARAIHMWSRSWFAGCENPANGA